jgi:hypothetical protein
MPVGEAATYTTHTRQWRQTLVPSVELESAIPAIQLLQTNACDRMAFGIGFYYICYMEIRHTRFSFSKPSSASVQNNYTKCTPMVMCTADATKTVESKGKQKETRSTTATKTTTEEKKYYKRKQ